jgi:hypothetical protein
MRARGDRSLPLPLRGGNEHAGASVRSQHDSDGAQPLGPVTIIFQQLGGACSVDVTRYGRGNFASYSPVVY